MTLDNIKTLYNEGDKETGRAQLIELLEAEPENAKAWAYFGAKTIDLEQRKYCYLKSLEFEPDNATIQARLDKLDEYDPVAPPEFELTDEDEDDPIAPPELVAVKKGVKGARNGGGMSTFQKLTLAILGLVAICIMGSLGVVMMYVVSDGKGIDLSQPVSKQIEAISLTVSKGEMLSDDKDYFESKCIAGVFNDRYQEQIDSMETVLQWYNTFLSPPYTLATSQDPKKEIWSIDRMYKIEEVTIKGKGAKNSTIHLAMIDTQQAMVVKFNPNFYDEDADWYRSMNKAKLDQCSDFVVKRLN